MCCYVREPGAGCLVATDLEVFLYPLEVHYRTKLTESEPKPERIQFTYRVRAGREIIANAAVAAGAADMPPHRLHPNSWHLQIPAGTALVYLDHLVHPHLQWTHLTLSLREAIPRIGRGNTPPCL